VTIDQPHTREREKVTVWGQRAKSLIDELNSKDGNFLIEKNLHFARLI
jgi:hypothetical protein